MSDYNVVRFPGYYNSNGNPLPRSEPADEMFRKLVRWYLAEGFSVEEAYTRARESMDED